MCVFISLSAIGLVALRASAADGRLGSPALVFLISRVPVWRVSLSVSPVEITSSTGRGTSSRPEGLFAAVCHQLPRHKANYHLLLHSLHLLGRQHRLSPLPIGSIVHFR